MFCVECGKDVKYKIGENEKGIYADDTGELMGTYIEKTAYCPHCKRILFVNEIEVENQKNYIAAIYKIGNIITEDEIKKITRKYGILRRYLNKIVGIEDFIDSDTSDLLREMYESKEKYLEVLEANKDKISEKVYQKSIAKVEKL